MNKRNQLNWGTTSTNDYRMLYLTIMRDIRAYCQRGYCELTVCFCHFMALPQSLIVRQLAAMKLSLSERHLIVDWSNEASVHVFLRRFVSLLSDYNQEQFHAKEFNEAYEEFTQYLTKNKQIVKS